jgi:hypothetical protein
MSSETTTSGVPTEKLRRFLHDVAAPLSAVALHLESASRRAAKGEDPTPLLEAARKDLDRVFELFEQGRHEMLAGVSRRQERTR